MSAGYKDFTAGSGLTAADLEDYCELQGIMRFASAAARDTALSSVKTEGMFAYLIDVNTITVYSGSAWSTIGPLHGALTSWTPTVTQLGAVTVTNTGSTYSRTGRLVTLNWELTVTGSGTAANDIVIGGIPFAARAGNGFFGNGIVFDTSASTDYAAMPRFVTTTTLKYHLLVAASSPYYLGSGSFTAALAVGDQLTGTIVYEAAADA